jgi:hypothetical protein
MPILKKITDRLFELIGLDFTSNHLRSRQSNKRHSYNLKSIKMSIYIYIYIYIYMGVRGSAVG